MSRAILLCALLLIVACGGQPSEQAATTAEPAPAAPPAPPAPSAEPAPAPAAQPAPAEPTAAEPVPAAEPEAPTAAKAVGSSSTKTGEPVAKKPAAAAEPVATKAPEAAKPAEAAPTASAAPCGEEGQPMCPLQAFMDRSIQKPMDAGDLAAVAKGLARAAKLAPDPAWNTGGAAGWSAIAQAGVDAANAGDAAATKQTCKTCHKAYRSKYKAEFRTKPL